MTANRISPLRRHRCPCGNRAIYPRPHGGVAARPDHPLCSRCWRSEMNREKAARTGWGAARLVLPYGILLPAA